MEQNVKEAFKKKLEEDALQSVAGGYDESTFFKILVNYTVNKNDPNPDHFFATEMTYGVYADETIGHIEQRTIDHSMCSTGTAQTYFHGAPVAKDMTLGALGIKPYETLDMELELKGFGWG